MAERSWGVELENAEGSVRTLRFGDWESEVELGSYAQLYLRVLTGDPSWKTVRVIQEIPGKGPIDRYTGGSRR